MPNYLITIDDEIIKLEKRISDLRIARDVLLTFAGEKSLVSSSMQARGAVKKERKITRKRGQAAVARDLVVTYLSTCVEPVPYRLIQQAIVSHKISDTTMWGVLKNLRDEGIVNWDRDVRLYSIAPMMKKEAKA